MKFLLLILTFGILASNAFWFWRDQQTQGELQHYTQGVYEMQASLREFKKVSSYFAKGLHASQLKRILEGEGHRCTITKEELRGNGVVFLLDSQGMVKGVR